MSTKVKKEASNVNLCYFDIAEIEEIAGLKLKMKHKNILWSLDSYGEEIYGSRSDIARKGGCSDQTVDSALVDLKNIGIVFVQHRSGTSNLYALNRELLRSTATQTRDSRRLKKSAELAALNEARDKWRIGSNEIQKGSNPESR